MAITVEAAKAIYHWLERHVRRERYCLQNLNALADELEQNLRLPRQGKSAPLRLELVRALREMDFDPEIKDELQSLQGTFTTIDALRSRDAGNSDTFSQIFNDHALPVIQEVLPKIRGEIQRRQRSPVPHITSIQLKDIIGKVVFSFLIPLIVAAGVASWQVYKTEHLAFVNGVKAFQMESAFIESWVKGIPDKAENQVVISPFNMDLARSLLNSRIFYFGDPGLGFLLTNYVAAGDNLLERIEAINRGTQDVSLRAHKGFFLDILYLLQTEFDEELALQRAEMRGTDRTVRIQQSLREVKDRWLPDLSDR